MTGKTVVVGHSMAGFPISRAAELDPSNIARLVYLCAYVPWPDLGLADQRRKAPYQPLANTFRVAADRITMGFDPAMARIGFIMTARMRLISRWKTCARSPSCPKKPLRSWA